ncbi:MAG: YkgJ family cysteine cluster protein [Magnetospirillum sp.]|nr:YkgJ family cysteine cluster protein [Magnetospirillum sp.]
MTISPATLRAADIEDRARSAATTVLTGGGGLAEAARAAIAVADGLSDAFAQQPELASALAGGACTAGCGSCCHQVVGITAAEEALLTEAIEQLPADRRRGLRCRVEGAQAHLERLPVEQWQAARLPCPLLEDNLCILHPHRPLPCRAVLSADADACRRWLEGGDVRIPLIALPRRIYSLAQAGLAQALAGAGIPPGPVSLVEALAVILS